MPHGNTERVTAQITAPESELNLIDCILCQFQLCQAIKLITHKPIIFTRILDTTAAELFLESEFGAQLTSTTFNNVKFNLGQRILVLNSSLNS